MSGHSIYPIEAIRLAVQYLIICVREVQHNKSTCTETRLLSFSSD